MCRAITCNKCQRPTWAGCGAHIEQVLGHVPPAERCQCRAGGAAGGKGGLGRTLRSLFGKS
jgi:hypothetical protein